MFQQFIAWLLGIGTEVLTFLEEAGTQIAKNGGPVLVQIATDAVLAAESNGGSGTDKRDAAFATIIAELKSKGIPVVVNAVNIALESAVANLKAVPAVIADPAPAAPATAS